MSSKSQRNITNSSTSESNQDASEIIENLTTVLKEQERLQNTSRRIVTAENQKELIEVLVTSINHIFDSGDEYLYLLNRDTDELEPVHDSEPQILSTLQSNIPGLIDWLKDEGRVTTLPVEDDWALEAEEVVFAPFVARSEFLGLLIYLRDLQSSETHQHFMNQIEFVAHRTAAALYNLHLRDTVEQQMEKIQQKENMLTNILESIKSGILVLNNSGKIIHYNRNATTMLDLDGPALVDKKLQELPETDIINGIQKVVNQTLEHGFSMEEMVEQNISEGNVIPIAIGCAQLRDQQMNNQGIVVILRDMTASKELERLRKLDQMKDEFVANVTHELRTPLTSIKAYTESLQDMIEENDTAIEFLEVIEEESDRLMALIEDLLSLSKITEGSMDLDRDNISLKDLLEHIIERCKATTDSHTFAFTFHTDRKEIRADYDLLYEVFENLISNAIKYSPDGGEISIDVHRDGAYIKVSIQDDGIGMTEEETEKIFDQFYRAPTANEQQIQGTGLGLAITQNIVDSHGGEILVDSEKGVGTTFTVALPIMD